MGAEGLAAGSDTLMDSVDSEQGGHTGSKVSGLKVGERSVLLCWLGLDVTSMATYEPVSCVSPPVWLTLSHPSVSSVSYFFMAALHFTCVKYIK